jgi:hypothetical protein
MYFIYIIIKKEKYNKNFRSRESNPEIKASKYQVVSCATTDSYLYYAMYFIYIIIKKEKYNKKFP